MNPTKRDIKPAHEQTDQPGALFAARVLAAHGSHFLLQSDDRNEHLAVSRARRQDLVVGDRVSARTTGAQSCIIETRDNRRNELVRSDRYKRKTLAANIDQAAYVIAGDPPFSEELLLRVHLAAAFESVEFAVLANKADLLASHSALAPRLALLRALGVTVFELSATSLETDCVEQLSPWLAGKTTVLLGQSGMGKSTLLNRLVPQAQMRTQEISERLQSGKHTTTYSRMFVSTSDFRTALIDTPGFQQFGLEHLSKEQLRYGALEFHTAGQRCRFNNCSHLDEPDCEVRASARDGRIDALRYRYFRSIVQEALRPSNY